MFTYILLTSVCFQHKLSFGFPPNEAEDYDSSAFPLSPLTPLTSFTRGVFFPLTFQCTCRPFFSHSLFFSAGLSVVLSLSHIHRQLFSLLSAKTFASLSHFLTLSVFLFFSLSSPNKYVCLCFTRLVELKLVCLMVNSDRSLVCNWYYFNV